jgi:hypothetical protein
MINIDKVEVFNFEGAFRGLRNPLESWAKSDIWVHTYQNALHPMSSFKPEEHQVMHYMGYDAVCTTIGERDLGLAQRMIGAGTDESKFMRQIFVSMDIEAPLYWWKEMDTYKVATVANSCSTMHKLETTPITLDCFSFDNDIPEGDEWFYVRDEMITHCERLRKYYLETKDKRYWRALVQLLPEAWNQKRTWTGNYQNLRGIYFARKNHKLVEWHKFCRMIESLPYGKELICYQKETNNEIIETNN